LRIPCATNRDLQIESESGRFRCDLYYRISVVSIKLPSLRERHWLTHSSRPMRMLFQGRQIVAVEAPLPATKRLPTDAKVATGARRVPAIEKVNNCH